MFLINLHAVPTKDSDHFENVFGAVVNVFIDYKDITGAKRLAKYYVEERQWKVGNIEDEYVMFNNIDEIEETSKDFYNQAKKNGYAMFFNCYNAD